MPSKNVYPEAGGLNAKERDFVKVVFDDSDVLVTQTARVFKAGNSLAIRIPSAIAKHIELEDGSAVELAVDHGVIVVRKAPSRTLQQLIERITPDNVHVSAFDEMTGAERW